MLRFLKAYTNQIVYGFILLAAIVFLSYVLHLVLTL